LIKLPPIGDIPLIVLQTFKTKTIEEDVQRNDSNQQQLPHHSTESSSTEFEGTETNAALLLVSSGEQESSAKN